MKLRLIKYALTIVIAVTLAPLAQAQQSSQPSENTQNPQTGAPTTRNAPGQTHQNEANATSDSDHHKASKNKGSKSSSTLNQSDMPSGRESGSPYQANFNKGDAKEAREQAEKAARVLDEIMGAADSQVPEWLFDKAECVAVFPSVVKAAFIVGGRGGKGVVTCRDPQTREWGAPTFLKIGGGSFGAQIGVQSTDIVLVGVNRSSIDAFTKDRLELGGEAEVAAGPLGRRAGASTDAPTFSSQFLSYSRNKGLFAGVSLQGAVIDKHGDLNRAVYGPDATAAGVMKSAQTTPAAVAIFPQTVAKYSGATKK